MLGQSPFGDNFRHATTAVLSSGVDCGEKAGMGRGGVRWDRGETGGLSSKFWDSYNQSRQVSGVSAIGDMYLRTHHHYKNSPTC